MQSTVDVEPNEDGPHEWPPIPVIDAAQWSGKTLVW